MRFYGGGGGGCHVEGEAVGDEAGSWVGLDGVVVSVYACVRGGRVKR